MLSVCILFQASVAVGQVHSELWGKAGEKWRPDGRLPDFSFAGYHFGEDPLPTAKAITDVRQFGAKGDGKTDCTQAFIRAIEATDKGAVTIPAGRYVISDIIWIKKPNIVLRGAGPGKTIICCVRDLEDVRSNMDTTTSGKPASSYSWSGGFVWVKGRFNEHTIATITSECKRGSTKLTIREPADLRRGQRIMVEVHDDDEETLISHLYSGDPGSTAKITKPIRTRTVSRITSVHGTEITLERPLRFDIRTSWSPVLKTFEPTVSEVGIEHLSIEFPKKPYKGHFSERGMNAIAMNSVSDCWVRNVQISNSDSGIFMQGSFCTIDRLTIESKRPDSRGTTGHHGIRLGMDCLVQNFDLKTRFIHDITLGDWKTGNVIKNGKGINLSLDHHKKGPYGNLFCNLDIGKGSKIWRCGGGRGMGKHCGARGTFWCIKAQQDISPPPAEFGPDSVILVGLEASGESQKNHNGKWFEAIPPEKLQPADLHAAQLARRLRLQSKTIENGPK